MLILTKPSVRNVICQCELFTILCCIGIGLLKIGAGRTVRFTPELYMIVANRIGRRVDQAKAKEIFLTESSRRANRQEYSKIIEDRLQSDPIHLEFKLPVV